MRAEALRTDWMGEPVVLLRAGGWEAMLVPRIGGTLVSLRDAARRLDLLNAPADPAAFERRPRIYGIPVIFPPNRIRDGCFEANGRSYRLPANSPEANHCHGLIGGLPWEVDETGSDAGAAWVAVSRTERPGTEFHAVFPHEFTFVNRYRLTAAGLEHEVVIRNSGAEPMPTGVGLHTALRVPFAAGTPAHAVRLRASVGKRWELDGRSLPTGKVYPLSHVEQGYRQWGLPVQGFQIRDHYGAEPLVVDGAPFHGAILDDPVAGLRLCYRVGPRFAHWMIWNDSAAQGFVCPEPMSWAIDAPNLRLPASVTGMLSLAPGEEWRERLSIGVEPVSP